MYKNYFKEKQSRKANVKISIRSANAAQVKSRVISDEDEDDGYENEDVLSLESILDKENSSHYANIDISGTPSKLKCNPDNPTLDYGQQSQIPILDTSTDIATSAPSGIDTTIVTSVPFTLISVPADNEDSVMTPQPNLSDSCAINIVSDLPSISNDYENNDLHEKLEFESLSHLPVDDHIQILQEFDEESNLKPAPNDFLYHHYHEGIKHYYLLNYQSTVILGIVLILLILCFRNPNHEIHVISISKYRHSNPSIRITSHIVEDPIYKLFSGNGKVIETKFEIDDAKHSRWSRNLHYPSKLLRPRHCVCDLTRSTCHGLLEPSNLSVTLNLNLQTGYDSLNYYYGDKFRRTSNICSACSKQISSSKACYYHWPENQTPRQLA